MKFRHFRRGMVVAVAALAVMLGSLSGAPAAQAAPPKPVGKSVVSTKPLAQFCSPLGEDVNSLAPFSLAGKDYIAVGGDISGYKDCTGHTHAASQLFILDASTGQFVWGASGITGGYIQALRAHLSGNLVTLYLGGGFSTVGGQKRSRAAAYEIRASGSSLQVKLSSTWRPSAARTVFSLDYGAGRIYMSGKSATAVSSTTGALLWKTSARCGVTAVKYLASTKSVYVGGLTREVGGVKGKGAFKLSASTGKVDRKFKPSIKANKRACDAKAANHEEEIERYSGSNPISFAWDAAYKRLVECDGGIYNAVRSLNPKTGKRYWQHRLDGDAQTCTIVGKELFVGTHRSGPNVGRYRYNRGNYSLMINSKTGKQKIWQLNPDLKGGGANRDKRNNGVIASATIDGKLFIGGAFHETQTAHQRLMVFHYRR